MTSVNDLFQCYVWVYISNVSLKHLALNVGAIPGLLFIKVIMLLKKNFIKL